jgi:hypothetical protein
MRLAPFAAAIAATALLLASLPADAQDRARTRITIQKRSYLDPGTVVKPGSMRYHDYAFPVETRNPIYGPYAHGAFGGSRWPLLGLFEGY